MAINVEELRKSQKEKALLNEIQSAIRSIRYGYIQIVIQDSKVVQIDKTEKVRLDRYDI